MFAWLTNFVSCMGKARRSALRRIQWLVFIATLSTVQTSSVWANMQADAGSPKTELFAFELELVPEYAGHLTRFLDFNSRIMKRWIRKIVKQGLSEDQRIEGPENEFINDQYVAKLREGIELLLENEPSAFHNLKPEVQLKLQGGRQQLLPGGMQSRFQLPLFTMLPGRSNEIQAGPVDSLKRMEMTANAATVWAKIVTNWKALSLDEKLESMDYNDLPPGVKALSLWHILPTKAESYAREAEESEDRVVKGIGMSLKRLGIKFRQDAPEDLRAAFENTVLSQDGIGTLELRSYVPSSEVESFLKQLLVLGRYTQTLRFLEMSDDEQAIYRQQRRLATWGSLQIHYSHSDGIGGKSASLLNALFFLHRLANGNRADLSGELRFALTHLNKKGLIRLIADDHIEFRTRHMGVSRFARWIHSQFLMETSQRIAALQTQVASNNGEAMKTLERYLSGKVPADVIGEEALVYLLEYAQLPTGIGDELLKILVQLRGPRDLRYWMQVDCLDLAIVLRELIETKTISFEKFKDVFWRMSYGSLQTYATILFFLEDHPNAPLFVQWIEEPKNLDKILYSIVTAEGYGDTLISVLKMMSFKQFKLAVNDLLDERKRLSWGSASPNVVFEDYLAKLIEELPKAKADFVKRVPGPRASVLSKGIYSCQKLLEAAAESVGNLSRGRVSH